MSEAKAEPVLNLKEIAMAFRALCPACEKAVREALLESLAQRQSRTSGGLFRLRRKIAERYGFDERAMLEHSNRAIQVRARREFCRRARAQGYSLSEIGAAINRDHTCALRMVRSNGWGRQR